MINIYFRLPVICRFRRPSHSIAILLCLLCFQVAKGQAPTNADLPNILFVIADDLGVDVSNGYHQGSLMPTTPTLDSLRAEGITFENVFAAPKCTPSRAAVMSGKFGVKTGVTGTPGNLDPIHTSIFKALETQTNNEYADAVVGKWHLSSPSDPAHPSELGVDYYMGVLGASVPDYYAWDKTENGTTTLDTNYATSVFTDAAINWVKNQDQEKPWFMWFAHTAPHSPFHEPPAHMYSIPTTGTNFRKYLAMIESVDYSLNRLLASMPDSVREKTLIIYIGDNGTPNNVLQDYPAGQGKSSMYQGGIRVPMIISGAGVSRKGERESALVHIGDIYATLLEIAGADLPGGIHNSLSFDHLLNNEAGPSRDYNYSELKSQGFDAWAIRGPQYKLIEFIDGSQEFYDLLTDSLETSDLLLQGLSPEQLLIKSDLEAEATQIRTAWSCRDYIQNGDEEGIDCGGSSCTPCMTTSANQPANGNGIQIYPNPATGQFNVQSAGEAIQEVYIYNALGEQLYQKQQINSTKETINIRHLPPQVYFVEIKLANQIKRIKLINN